MSFLPGFFPGAAGMTITEEVDAMAILITSGTVISAATLDLVFPNPNVYRAIVIRLDTFIPATDDADLWLRTSTDGGANYGSGASDYSWITLVLYPTAVSPFADTADAQIQIVPSGATGVSNIGSEGCMAVQMTFSDPNDATKRTIVDYSTSYFSSGGSQHHVNGSGLVLTAQDTNAIRLLFSSGNIAYGKYAMYGME